MHIFCKIVLTMESLRITFLWKTQLIISCTWKMYQYILSVQSIYWKSCRQLITFSLTLLLNSVLHQTTMFKSCNTKYMESHCMVNEGECSNKKKMFILSIFAKFISSALLLINFPNLLYKPELRLNLTWFLIYSKENFQEKKNISFSSLLNEYVKIAFSSRRKSCEFLSAINVWLYEWKTKIRMK